MSGKKVVLDTNFLLVPYQFGIDVFVEIERVLQVPHEFIIPSGVIGEVERLGKGKGKEGAAARFAAKLLGKNKCTVVPSEGNVDNWIFEYALKEEAVVATNDRLLRNRLKKRRVKVISLRSRSGIGVV
jgi:rRNA-processing protein FCF1